MPRTCYLHIGMPKTGSSSIQASLKNYQDARIDYAKLGPENHSVPLCTIYAREPHRFFLHRQNDRSMPQVAELKQKFRFLLEKAFHGDKDLILSGEMLADHISPDEVGEMLADLREHFDRVRVIAYIRPAPSLLPSMLQQRIRMGLRRFELPPPSYRRRFQPWVQHAGAENVSFHRFDRAELAGGDVVEDFATRLDLDLTRIERLSRNESMSLEAMAILYCHNIFEGSLLSGPKQLHARSALAKLLAGFGNGKTGLAPTLMEPLLAANRPDLDWMEQVAGFSVSDPVAEVENPIRSEQHLIMIGRRAMPALREELQKTGPATARSGVPEKLVAAARSVGSRLGNLS